MPRPYAILLDTAIRCFDLSEVTLENIEKAYSEKVAEFDITSYLKREKLRLIRKINRENSSLTEEAVMQLAEQKISEINRDEMAAFLSNELEKINDMYQLLVNHQKPLETLGLAFDTELTKEIIDRAFRQFSKKNISNHPDRGGDGSLFVAGELAKTILLLRLESDSLENDNSDLRLLDTTEVPAFVPSAYGQSDGYKQTVFQTKSGGMLLVFSSHNTNHHTDIGGNIFQLYVLESNQITSNVTQSIRPSVGIWLPPHKISALLALANEGNLSNVINCFEAKDFRHRSSHASSSMSLKQHVSIAGETARDINTKMSETSKTEKKKSIWGFGGFGLLRSTVESQARLTNTAEQLLLENSSQITSTNT